jgi:hypothetical protein
MRKFGQLQNADVVSESSEDVLDPALELVLTRIRIRAKRRVAWLRKLWSNEVISGGKQAVTHEEIDTYLDNLDSPEAEAAWYDSNKSVSQWNHELAKLELEMASDNGSRLAQLYHTFSLSVEEFDLFQTCLAVLLDPSLARVYAYLHDHAGRSYPTEQLAARLFGHGRRSLWSPESPLHRWELVREKEVGPGEPPQLICDNLIRNWLQGYNHLDELLVGISKTYEPLSPLSNWPVDKTVALIKRMLNDENPESVLLRIKGPPGSGRRTFAAVISFRIGLSLLGIDADQIDAQNWHQVFVRAQRQAYLGQFALAWYGESALLRAWTQVVPFFPVQFLICESDQAPLPVSGITDQLVEMPSLSLEERHMLWRRFVPVSTTWPKDAFNKLVIQHRVNVGDIALVTKKDLQNVKETTILIREITRHRLGRLAQLLECPFAWDDLVITDNLREALEDLTFEASERVDFWERSEALRLFPQGRGLIALFSGPPGTGKTMAAQVIAANLGLDLFRIDLSAVVSKYVGETSQNLENILSHATQMDIILLFDEADALFGKRTEIKDAHDRFANTDTAYLLQAIEDYRGIALLATNKKGNVDPAFIRRIRYVLNFPKPDAKQRGQIWRNIINVLAGAKCLKALESDLKLLATDLELTGAQIKFAVLAAFFVAKKDRKKIAMSHLLQGVDRELMKEGRALSGRERERFFKHGS